MGININKSKTKYIKTIRNPDPKEDTTRILDYEFPTGISLKYKGPILTDKNYINEELNARLASDNIYLFAIQRILKFRGIADT